MAGVERAGGVDDRRQRFVLDRDPLSGVARLDDGIGDDHRDRVADMAHPLAGDRGMRRRCHRRLVTVGDSAHAGDRADAGLCEICTGEHREHPRRTGGGAYIKCADPGMRMGRAQHRRIGLSRADDVVEVMTMPGQEAPVFDPADRLADPKLLHCELRRGSTLNIGCATPPVHAAQIRESRERIRTC